MPWGRRKGIENECFTDRIFKEQGWKAFGNQSWSWGRTLAPEVLQNWGLYKQCFPKSTPTRKGLGVWVPKDEASKFHAPCPDLRWVKSTPPCGGRGNSSRPRLARPAIAMFYGKAGLRGPIDWFPSWHWDIPLVFGTPMWVERPRWEQKGHCHCPSTEGSLRSFLLTHLHLHMKLYYYLF